MPILEVNNVSKSYASHKALDAVSFQLDAGFHALLGPNGAGKSTLFQLLTGLFVPDSGSIVVNGQDIRQHLVAALAGIGVVFQQPSLDLDLTVQANLTFYGRLHGMADQTIKARAAAELAKLDMVGIERQRVRTLSGGNRRKVELVRALLTEPKLLLMDEATVGLDPASRELLLRHVGGLCREQGLSVLWATHLIDEAEQADQVLVLHKGKLLKQATPASVVAESGAANLLEAFLKLSGQRLPETKAALLF